MFFSHFTTLGQHFLRIPSLPGFMEPSCLLPFHCRVWSYRIGCLSNWAFSINKDIIIIIYPKKGVHFYPPPPPPPPPPFPSPLCTGLHFKINKNCILSKERKSETLYNLIGVSSQMSSIKILFHLVALDTCMFGKFRKMYQSCHKIATNMGLKFLILSILYK